MNTTVTWALRNGVQFAVAAVVTWAISKTGVVIEDTDTITDTLSLLVFGVLLMVLPPVFDKLSKIPGIGPHLIAYLNGPPRNIEYTKK